MSSYLLNVHSWKKQTECFAVTGKFVSAPNHWSAFRSSVKKKFPLIRRWMWLVNCGDAESTNFPFCFVRIHWRELLLEGNEVRLAVMEQWKNGQKTFISFSIFSLCATWVLIIADITLFLSWISNAKWQLYISLWHGQVDKEGLQSPWKTSACWLWPYMSYQSMWQLTSKCSNVLQLSAETLFQKTSNQTNNKSSVIPAMADEAGHSFFFSFCF